MKKIILCMCAFFTVVLVFANQPVVQEALKKYTAAGGSNFSAQRGKEMWSKKFTVKGESRSCVSCHTADLTKTGKRADTGKSIKPMSKSVNPKRYTDPKFIKKWFDRNCRWTMGRLCTAQEKGDYLLYLSTN